MNIAFSGAHRTGKSTLAEYFSKKNGIEYVMTDISGIFKERGLSPRDKLPFDTRMDIQWEILKRLKQTYHAAKTPFVTDRSPIDLMAYLLSEIGPDNVSEDADMQIAGYFDECARVVQRHLSAIILVQPGIEVVEDSSKAPATFGYMEHINIICKGLIGEPRFGETSMIIMSRKVTDLNERLLATASILKDVRGMIMRKARDSVEEGDFMH